jgi:hypothetical protein
MKRGMLLMAYMVVAVLFTSCGGSEQDCTEQCALSFSKSHSQCNANHERFSSEGVECSKIALKENDQCSARCYGNQ